MLYSLVSMVLESVHMHLIHILHGSSTGIGAMAWYPPFCRSRMTSGETQSKQGVNLVHIASYQRRNPDSKVHGVKIGAHLGQTGPRWAPCWPHEPCYLGTLSELHGILIAAIQPYLISTWMCSTQAAVGCNIAKNFSIEFCGDHVNFHTSGCISMA